ncbi:MAG: hypothetical protein COX43_00700 [Parcubacteria group bacterium CG23_combo_of_CG06-09_8_20_14_all_35_9]|nr:MAG: hypothetical protein COX43_00700 [Parcubacteria group bacterium CG23_combo_of_CG06-09_8_20_14_all_35_9]
MTTGDVSRLAAFRIAAVSRSVAEQHKDNNGNYEPLDKTERSDISSNVRVYLMFCGAKRSKIWVEAFVESRNQIYAVIGFN